MSEKLKTKTEKYEQLLEAALTEASPAQEQAVAGKECIEMAQSYLRDGQHFKQDDDLVNALAAFSYGHGWLDAGARVGVLEVPTQGHLFTQ